MTGTKTGMGTVVEFDYRINMIKSLNFISNKVITSESENQIRKTFRNVHDKYFVSLVQETFR